MIIIDEVVLGLDVGVLSMKQKEKAQFIFEPEYYCGKFGCEPRVPKETPVLFEGFFFFCFLTF
jgi:FKBP-type peptidyl-prolyl cis-trans isomerase